MTAPIAYLNGRYVPIDDARLHVFDLGIVGGTSVTEMARTFGHVPFRLPQHLDRLMASCDCVGLDVGLIPSELNAICERVVRENSATIPKHHDLGLIVFVTAGMNLTYVGRTGMTPGCTVCVHTFPLPFELWANMYDVGQHLVTVPTRSIPDAVINARVKHRSRMHWHIAGREAREIAPHAAAVLTDGDGRLTETASGNLCAVDGTTIITPLSNVLEGISRDVVAELASSLGLEFIHASLTPDELSRADEAFVTSTPHCLVPVTRFNQSPIGDGRPGPVFKRLIEAWNLLVGIDIVAQMKAGAKDRTA
jgi:branched-subunit amino acid aminotransferase/4-amino-4-deoxychorismate lyase